MSAGQTPFEYLPLAILQPTELRELFGCTVADPDFYFRLAYHLARQDEAWLLAQLPTLDSVRLRAALFGLGHGDEQAPLLRTYLEHTDELVVMGCIDSLRLLEHWQSWPQIAPLARHKSPFVQAAVLRFECAYKEEDALPSVIQALQSLHPLVRENALDELDYLPLERHQKLALARPFLTDPNSAVREAAQFYALAHPTLSPCRGHPATRNSRSQGKICQQRV